MTSKRATPAPRRLSRAFSIDAARNASTASGFTCTWTWTTISDPAGGMRLSLLVARVDGQAGDVVVAAALVGEVDEDGRHVAVAVAGQHLGQLLDGQVVGQAVGAEHEAVARLHRQPLQVGLDARLEPDRPGDDVAEARLLCLLGRDQAGPDLLLDPRLIPAELPRPPVAVEIGARVADVRHVRVPAVEQQRGQRR